MQIIWHGQSCFQIISNQGKQGQVSIVIDPYSEDIGLRIPKLEANILLSTHKHHDHNNIKAVGGNPFLIQGPGEYEVKDVFIQGIFSFHDQASGQERGDNTIYTIEVAESKLSSSPFAGAREAEDLKLCHFGDFGQKELTSEQIEKIGEVDILMIPVGGVFTISAKEAAKIMSQIEPSITIPMHYHLPKLKIKPELDGIDKFFKVMGIKKLDSLSKLSVKKKDISSEEAKIVVLNP